MDGLCRAEAEISSLGDRVKGDEVTGGIDRVPGVAARLAGAAGRARLVIMLVVILVEVLVVREPYEIVVFSGLEVGSRGYDGALQRHG